MKSVKSIAMSFALTALFVPSVRAQAPTEAPTGFDGLTNGFLDDTEFAEVKGAFEEVDQIDDGLGPVYNAQSCAECHQNPITGGISQITELRVGHLNAAGAFVNPVGGRSLINDRATDAATQMRVPGTETIRTFRTSLNVLGDGFVEAIDSNTLLAISNSQPAALRGEFIQVPVLEAGNALRGGRFGWKNQHASLVSFASDAYLNEQGVTNQFNLVENNALGLSTAAFPGYLVNADPVKGEDNEGDIFEFANFMRSSKPPSRDTVLAATADARAGDTLFNQIGCNTCHVRSIVTAPAGTVINQGAFTVPAALGNKIIHPFSDFLLHDVGTGDGILQNGPADTANKVRTPPLWGVRTRDRLMHDGLSLTRNDAILRHAGQATGVVNSYINLTLAQKNQLIAFINSL